MPLPVMLAASFEFDTEHSKSSTTIKTFLSLFILQKKTQKIPVSLRTWLIGPKILTYIYVCTGICGHNQRENQNHRKSVEEESKQIRREYT